jgi:hypothetical protein
MDIELLFFSLGFYFFYFTVCLLGSISLDKHRHGIETKRTIQCLLPLNRLYMRCYILIIAAEETTGE